MKKYMYLGYSKFRGWGIKCYVARVGVWRKPRLTRKRFRRALDAHEYGSALADRANRMLT